ncbi:efflux pump mlcE [Colletotrichum liriopes]|uniref:Efflux pump mlcE n=1 Tax=Colletotrichum liriopes TaxID=708192 RepID=A0AA37LUY6_9PEZI|nr:efflux pump mlcE [Colletotrichum liriopes]
MESKPTVLTGPIFESEIKPQNGTQNREETSNEPEPANGIGLSQAAKEKLTSDTSDDSSGDEQDDHGYITGFKLFAVLGSITLVAFLMLLDGSIIGTAVPSITTEFHSLDDVGWYVAAYQLSRYVLPRMPKAGVETQMIHPLTDMTGQWTYLVFFALFEIGSLICGLANSSVMLIAGRAIAGLGGSGLLNGGMTIIAGAIPLEKRPCKSEAHLLSEVESSKEVTWAHSNHGDLSRKYVYYITLPATNR